MDACMDRDGPGRGARGGVRRGIRWGTGGASGPRAAPSDLVPSGLTLAGGTGEGDVVVDGAGMVWVDGPWQVARVDPATGEATIWDAADDLAFTSVQRLAPAQPAGVWLDSGDRVRLFDGERFLVDIAVPAQYADVPDGRWVPRARCSRSVTSCGPAARAAWAGGLTDPGRRSAWSS